MAIEKQLIAKKEYDDLVFRILTEYFCDKNSSLKRVILNQSVLAIEQACHDLPFEEAVKKADRVFPLSDLSAEKISDARNAFNSMSDEILEEEIHKAIEIIEEGEYWWRRMSKEQRKEAMNPQDSIIPNMFFRQ